MLRKSRQGHLVITPDGPRGPRFKFKPGALLLAQMSGRPILPMSYAASHAWLIKWDRFVIPVPFSRIAIAIGPPVYVPRVNDAASLEQLQAKMEDMRKDMSGALPTGQKFCPSCDGACRLVPKL